MTVRDSIHTEIDNLDEKYLDELYQIVRHFVDSKADARHSSLLARLRQIQIDGPEDFAAEHDSYIAGAKGADPNLG
jgi:hypothetical protein